MRRGKEGRGKERMVRMVRRGKERMVRRGKEGMVRGGKEGMVRYLSDDHSEHLIHYSL